MISTLIIKMIQNASGNVHDICHFLKVYAYAKTIGECEGLDAKTQQILEAAAVVHDIACPLCRAKYGNTSEKNQEREGPALALAFLEDSGLSDEAVGRIAYLVGHHHTPGAADGMDYQILIEADYLVNAGEAGHSKEKYKTPCNIFLKPRRASFCCAPSINCLRKADSAPPCRKGAPGKTARRFFSHSL